MASKLTIGFLGAGKMATALAKGFVRAGLVTAQNISASDPSKAACASFTEQVGAKTSPENLEVLKSAEVIFLAVKPQQMGEVLEEISLLVPEQKRWHRC